MSLSDELELVNRLRRLNVPCSAFDGVTSYEQRRERVRAAIRRVATATYSEGVSMGEQFERVYGESLERALDRK
jgi:hypothetical protein